MTVVATWPIIGAKPNFPMALDEANHRLFVGCRRPAKVLVFDTATGKLSDSFDVKEENRRLAQPTRDPASAASLSVETQAQDGRSKFHGRFFRDESRCAGLEKLLARIRIGRSGKHDDLRLWVHARNLATRVQ
jgi:hypothetical protein